MHAANRKFWQHSFKRYAAWFTPGSSVLEVGSYVENGSLREAAPPGLNYLGIDWRNGPGVDLVCEAKNVHDALRGKTGFPGSAPYKFDAVLSASMLEHDAEWWLSIPAMCAAVSAHGLLILTWGAANNPPHYHETAIDGCFHALPVGKVLDALEEQKFYVHELRYEYLLPYIDASDRNGLDRGCVALVATPQGNAAAVKACGPRELDPLLPEDDVYDSRARAAERTPEGLTQGSACAEE